jgi:hypothetical protein
MDTGSILALSAATLIIVLVQILLTGSLIIHILSRREHMAIDEELRRPEFGVSRADGAGTSTVMETIVTTPDTSSSVYSVPTCADSMSAAREDLLEGRSGASPNTETPQQPRDNTVNRGVVQDERAVRDIWGYSKR